MKRVEGKVAFITGAARGQGRAFAIRLAEEGADLILSDVSASNIELEETVAVIEKLGRRAIYAAADVRNLPALEGLIEKGAKEFGRLDIVVANAGIITWGRFWEMSPQRWQDMIDINLTGVYNTFRAAAPTMIQSGNGGSIIAISSVAALKPLPGQAHYSAAKAGVVGLVISAAQELAPYRIRVNSVHPWGVKTGMTDLGEDGEKIFKENPTYASAMGQILLDPVVSEPEDIANAVLFLASDESRTMTAAQIPVDHGASKI